jgi:hypothetical protein
LSRTITKTDARETLPDADAPRGPILSRAAWLVAPLVVAIVTGWIYGSIYFREDSLATGIGANLVPAERILKGEVPYRDFYKIQTPGILLLNAGLFKAFGTTLLTAFRGVLVFKILAITLVFLVARRVVSQTAALLVTTLSLVWLPPGGPFRPAPIQYEMVFILAAVFFALRWIDFRNARDAFAAGLAVGLVAVFKQNVGVYMSVALGITLVVNTQRLPRSLPEAKNLYLESWRDASKSHLAAALGVALPLLALVGYLLVNKAIGAALRVFIKGPGEHIQMKLTGYPLPKQALIVFAAVLMAMKIIELIWRRSPRFGLAAAAAAVAGAASCAVLAPQSFIDNSIFWFPPALFAACAWHYARTGSRDQSLRNGVLLVLLAFSIASYLEVFPRSVRGLLIGTLPPVFILLAFIFEKTLGAATREAWRLARWQLAIVTVVAFVFASRLIVPRYATLYDGRLWVTNYEELSFERGRGIYLAAGRAAEVNATVNYVQSRVGEQGYFFAHALDATPYYFLADRNSPTGATLWNDAGTSDAERVRTMEMLKQQEVGLVLTSEKALEAERYEPLLEYLRTGFHRTEMIGKIIALEKN